MWEPARSRGPPAVSPPCPAAAPGKSPLPRCRPLSASVRTRSAVASRGAERRAGGSKQRGKKQWGKNQRLTHLQASSCNFQYVDGRHNSIHRHNYLQAQHRSPNSPLQPKAPLLITINQSITGSLLVQREGIRLHTWAAFISKEDSSKITVDSVEDITPP